MGFFYLNGYNQKNHDYKKYVVDSNLQYFKPHATKVGKTFAEEPIDVYADYLSHEMTFITMPKNYLKNIKQAFIECDIEIDRVISSIFSLGAHLLTNSELKTGSIIIDLGYEKTSLGIFKNLAPVHSFTLPIGVNHITKDISKVCSLTIEESEIIRNEINV